MESFFMWETPKLVVVKSRFLGYGYLLMMVLVLFGGLFSSLQSRVYLEIDTKPSGVVRVKFSEPDWTSLHGEDADAFLPETLEKLPWVHWDEYEVARSSSVDGDSIFITTQFEDKVERRCNEHDAWERIVDKQFFVEHIEEFRLKVEHTLFASLFHTHGRDETEDAKWIQSNRKMFGNLVSRPFPHKHTAGDDAEKAHNEQHKEHEDEVEDETEDHRTVITKFPVGKADVMTVGQLLQAASFELDELSDVTGHTDQSYRMRGSVLQVSIRYSNLAPVFGLFPFVNYTLHVERLMNTGYKVEDRLDVAETEYRALVEENDECTYRLRRRRHGVFVKFIQEGEIGRVSWFPVIVHTISTFSCLSLLTFLLEKVAEFVLGDFFVSARYETIADEAPPSSSSSSSSSSPPPKSLIVEDQKKAQGVQQRINKKKKKRN